MDSSVRLFTKPKIGSNNNRFSLKHSSNRLEYIMEDTLGKYPEDSFYFLNEGELRAKAQLIQNSFLPDQTNSFLAYAVKACPQERVLEILSSEGVNHFDCASPAEIELVKFINPSAKVLYNHPIKRSIDIKRALELGARHFTVQTEREVVKILNQAQCPEEELEIVVRFATYNDDAIVNLSKKFGATAQSAIKTLHFLKNKTKVKVGLSFHTGSQNQSPHTFKTAIQKMIDIVDAVKGVDIVNFGGGLPANYSGSQKYSLEQYFATMNTNFDPSKIFRSPDYQIFIEPGRAVVAEAVDLLVPVISIEERLGEKVAYIHDGCFTSFSPADPPNANAQFKVLRHTDSGIQILFGTLEKYRVFGRTCDSADDLGCRQIPNNIREGDWIWHASAGAYSSAYASNFNGFSLPKWISYNL